MLVHRGPDGGGYWLGNTDDGRFQIGLGNRRLSIIDIAGGTQPMWSADGTIAVVYNGEIYNYIELRMELQSRGCVFSTSSDTEVLIHAYAVWGLDAIVRLRGMFGFALWDSKRQSVLLARDPFGKKPLFLCERNGQMLFGSELAPLLEFPGIDKRLNREALSQYLLRRYVPGPLTFFDGIEKLPPGHFAIWQNGSLRKTRYFNPPLATAAPDIDRFDDAIVRFDQLFDESVRLRMRSDAPFGAYLSGGIDSSAIVSAMVRYSSGPLRTFTAGFREKPLSEIGHAWEIADVFGTEHHELFVEPDAFFAAWPDAVRRRGAPASEMADVVIMLLSRLAHSSVKMVLTGEGSDEMLAGYPKYRAEPWIELYQGLVPPFAHRLLFAPLIRALPYKFHRAKVVAMAAGERDFDTRMAAWFGGMSTADRMRLARGAPSARPNDVSLRAGSASSLRRMLYFDQTSWLPDNLLERGDRMMMAGSIEGRMPFMDTELAAFVARLPDQFLTGARGGKRILRASLKKRLPQHILDRPKLGFRVPVDAWFRGAYGGLLRELLTSAHSRTAALCDRGFVGRLVSRHVEGRSDNSRVLWSLANLEMFLREFELDAESTVERGPQIVTHST
jgi:asparagine synthase (glutamine-hydrolysing)